MYTEHKSLYFYLDEGIDRIVLAFTLTLTFTSNPLSVDLEKYLSGGRMKVGFF